MYLYYQPIYIILYWLVVHINSYNNYLSIISGLVESVVVPHGLEEVSCSKRTTLDHQTVGIVVGMVVTVQWRAPVMMGRGRLGIVGPPPARVMGNQGQRMLTITTPLEEA